MSNKSSDKDCNQKPIQADIAATIQKENTDQLIEMAAEQLADLLWKCWQARNTTRRDKRTKSGSRLDSPGSS